MFPEVLEPLFFSEFDFSLKQYENSEGIYHSGIFPLRVSEQLKDSNYVHYWLRTTKFPNSSGKLMNPFHVPPFSLHTTRTSGMTWYSQIPRVTGFSLIPQHL
jgi:hypothetical protein